MTTITLSPPLEITSRLLPGITVDGVSMSAEPTGKHDRCGRAVWRLIFDKYAPGKRYRSYVDETLAGPRSYAAAVETALAFLLHSAGAYASGGWNDEEARLFPRPVVAWAAQNSSELESIQLELSETLESRD